MSTQHNYTQLIAAITVEKNLTEDARTTDQQTYHTMRRDRLQGKADVLKVEVDRAVDLGLDRFVAERRSPNWLDTFIKVEERERARLERERGSAGLEAGARARRTFGV